MVVLPQPGGPPTSPTCQARSARGNATCHSRWEVFAGGRSNMPRTWAVLGDSTMGVETRMCMVFSSSRHQRPTGQALGLETPEQVRLLLLAGTLHQDE